MFEKTDAVFHSSEIARDDTIKYDYDLPTKICKPRGGESCKKKTLSTIRDAIPDS